MLTFPAFWLLLVSLFMVTLFRLRSPGLLMKTWPDWVSPVSTSTCFISSQGISIVTVACSLVVIDESFI